MIRYTINENSNDFNTELIIGITSTEIPDIIEKVLNSIKTLQNEYPIKIEHDIKSAYFSGKNQIRCVIKVLYNEDIKLADYNECVDTIFRIANEYLDNYEE